MFGYHAYMAITVRKPNAYAMQSAGQLIVEHMRLHSGSFPGGWEDLRDTCEASDIRILAKTADGEIEEIRKRIDIDWEGGIDALRNHADQGQCIENTLVRLRSGRCDWFVGVEPNELIFNYLKGTTEPDGAANRSQPIRADTNRTSVTAGSDR